MIEIHNRSATFIPPDNAAYLMGDFTDWDETPLPITGPMTLEFPQGAYIEYAFLDMNKQPLADPENHQMPKHPWYEYHRAFTLPLNRFAEPPQPHVFRGNITDHSIVAQSPEPFLPLQYGHVEIALDRVEHTSRSQVEHPSYLARIGRLVRAIPL